MVNLYGEPFDEDAVKCWWLSKIFWGGGGWRGVARDMLWNCSECPMCAFKDGFTVWFGHTILESKRVRSLKDEEGCWSWQFLNYLRVDLEWIHKVCLHLYGIKWNNTSSQWVQNGRIWLAQRVPKVQPFITLRKAEGLSLAAYSGLMNKHDLSEYFTLLRGS